MGPNNNLNSESLFQERFESVDIGTRRIPDDQTRRQMDDFRAVLYHFFAGILDVSTRATIACGVADQLDASFRISAESALTILDGAKALAAGASPVAVTDNDSNFGMSTHGVSLSGRPYFPK
jgi:hypothetical protein